MVKKYKNRVQLAMLCTLSLGLLQSSFVETSTGKATPYAKKPRIDAAFFERSFQPLDAEFGILQKSLDLKIKAHTIGKDDLEKVTGLLAKVDQLHKQGEAAGLFIDDEDLGTEAESLIRELEGYAKKCSQELSAPAQPKTGKVAANRGLAIEEMLKKREAAGTVGATSSEPKKAPASPIQVLPEAKVLPVSPGKTSLGSVSSAKFNELTKSIATLQNDETKKFNEMTDKLIAYRKDQKKDASAILTEYAATVQHILSSCAKGNITEHDAQQLIGQYQKNFEELQKILIGMFI